AAPPPPPPPLFVVVVVLPVVLVDVDDEPVVPVLVESGVVVVMVVTTVGLPVVTVETIVVVACAPKGAAPAVKAAVAAPSAIRAAKAAPQRASFRYLLVMRPPLPRRTRPYSRCGRTQREEGAFRPLPLLIQRECWPLAPRRCCEQRLRRDLTQDELVVAEERGRNRGDDARPIERCQLLLLDGHADLFHKLVRDLPLRLNRRT